MHRKIALGAVLALLMSGTAVAATQADRAPIQMETDVAAIVEQQTKIQRDARDRRGRYRDMAGADRDRLLQTQERVLGRVHGRARTTELSHADQQALFNDLETISALVNKAEDERMVCERTRPIGSNRPVSVCKTVAQRRAERERMLQSTGGRDARCEGGCPTGTGAYDWP